MAWGNAFDLEIEKVADAKSDEKEPDDFFSGNDEVGEVFFKALSVGSIPVGLKSLGSERPFGGDERVKRFRRAAADRLDIPVGRKFIFLGEKEGFHLIARGGDDSLGV